MNDKRDIGWFWGGLMLWCLSVGQCTTNRELDRIADTQQLLLCTEALKVGVEREKLPDGCFGEKGK